LTDSPTWIGIVSFMRGLPMLLLSLPGGVLVDRLDRGRLLLVTQVIAGLVPAALAIMLWTGTATPVLIAMLAFVAGTVYVVIIPARQALIPLAVPRQQVAAAIGLVSAGTNAGRVLGPTIGGIVMAGLGLAATFWVQAALTVVAIALSFRVPASGQSRTASKGSPLADRPA
jgi:MFS family permease